MDVETTDMSVEEPVFSDKEESNYNENNPGLENQESSSSSSGEENTRNNEYPEVPVSPSSKVKDETYSPSPNFMKPKEEEPRPLKKEIQRKPNAEYNSFIFLNIWFCFYFRFVCRCTPIQDEDIYDINPENKTDLVTYRTTKYWEEVYKEYDEKRNKYENEKKNKSSV